MKVGFFSPLPPAHTGVADYASALVQALRSHGSVSLHSADADVALYHLGNNRLHRTIYENALARPGIVVLHDAVLQHFFLGWLDEAHYVEEFVYNYGEWMRGLAGELWKNRARSAADPCYFNYPMLKRIASASRAVIVHNPAAARIVKRHAPEVRIAEIPHLFVPPGLPSAVDTLRFRSEAGIGPRTLLVGVFGHLRESKRLPVVLRAMERAWRLGADARLLVAGAFASSDVERSIAPLLVDRRILRAGHLPEKDFWRYAVATDLCINLRFPTAAETSGIAIRMMGIGKTVVFTSGVEIARIPEKACLRVDLGAAEEEMLAGYILWLSSDREAAVTIGRNAAAHIAKEHAIDAVAKQYWEVLSAYA
jgi:glycosyltransferase involved in cell wall biosynthesis